MTTIHYEPHTERLRGVERFVRELFEQRLPRNLLYHNVDHTMHSERGVASVANKLALLERASPAETELIVAAAYLHDTGYTEQYKQNEPIGARIAGQVLPTLGYPTTEVISVQQMILTTQIPTNPNNRLEMILCDADVDNLGRDDFFERGEELRQELEISDIMAWYKGSAKFQESHRYYTASAQALRNEGKQRNLLELYARIRELEQRQ